MGNCQSGYLKPNALGHFGMLSLKSSSGWQGCVLEVTGDNDEQVMIIGRILIVSTVVADHKSDF